MQANGRSPAGSPSLTKRADTFGGETNETNLHRPGKTADTIRAYMAGTAGSRLASTDGDSHVCFHDKGCR